MSIYGNPVMLGGSGGGGGGSTNVLSGTAAPTAAQGNNGAMYLQYAGSHGLPSGYDFCLYIEVTSAGPYIDTGVANNSTAYVELDAQYTENPGNNYGWFGAQTTIEYTVNTYGGVFFVNFGAGRTVIPWGEVLSRHIIKVDDTRVSVDNGAYTGGVNWANTTGRNYYLFAINYSGGALTTANARVYGCKLYNGSTLVRDFVPCIRQNDDTVGMYDVVNNTFYSNAGTGTFVAGPTGEPVTNAYAKVNGTWQDLIGTDINDINLGS